MTWLDKLEAGSDLKPEVPFRWHTIVCKEVHESELIPWWLGVAYWRWDMRAAECYVIPLNLIIRWARNAFFWAKATRRPDWFAEQLRDQYDRGHTDGWHAGNAVGYAAGRKVGVQEGDKQADDRWIAWWDNLRNDISNILKS